MTRREIIEENSKQAFLGEETGPPTKVVLALKLITTVVGPKGQVLKSPMKSINTFLVVDVEDMLNEESHLLVPFLQIRRDTRVRHTTDTIQLVIPEVNDQHKENSFCPNLKQKRNFKHDQNPAEVKACGQYHVNTKKITCRNNLTVVLGGR